MVLWHSFLRSPTGPPPQEVLGGPRKVRFLPGAPSSPLAATPAVPSFRGLALASAGWLRLAAGSRLDSRSGLDFGLGFVGWISSWLGFGWISVLFGFHLLGFWVDLA